MYKIYFSWKTSLYRMQSRKTCSGRRLTKFAKILIDIFQTQVVGLIYCAPLLVLYRHLERFFKMSACFKLLLVSEVGFKLGCRPPTKCQRKGCANEKARKPSMSNTIIVLPSWVNIDLLNFLTSTMDASAMVFFVRCTSLKPHLRRLFQQKSRGRRRKARFRQLEIFVPTAAQLAQHNSFSSLPGS